VLGVLLPVALGLGIAARKPVPRMDGTFAELSDGAIAKADLVWQRDRLFTNAPIQVELLWESGSPAPLIISCKANDDFVRPDVLVYWCTAGNITDSLPNDAILLGTFSTPRLKLPLDATQKDGMLVLYSLADQEVVAVSLPVRFNDSGK